jgi:hypothetical protein
VEALIKMRATKEISRTAFLEEMKRRGVLSEDFDAEDDAALREEEAEEMPDGMNGLIGPAQMPGRPGLPAPAPAPKKPAPAVEE